MIALETARREITISEDYEKAVKRAFSTLRIDDTKEKMNKFYRKLVRNVSARDIFRTPISCKVIKSLSLTISQSGFIDCALAFG